MNAILLLRENTEPVTSADFNLPRVTVHEGDSTLGCTCDRWGHPCKRRRERKSAQPDAGITNDQAD